MANVKNKGSGPARRGPGGKYGKGQKTAAVRPESSRVEKRPAVKTVSRRDKIKRASYALIVIALCLVWALSYSGLKTIGGSEGRNTVVAFILFVLGAISCFLIRPLYVSLPLAVGFFSAMILVRSDLIFCALCPAAVCLYRRCLRECGRSRPSKYLAIGAGVLAAVCVPVPMSVLASNGEFYGFSHIPQVYRTGEMRSLVLMAAIYIAVLAVTVFVRSPAPEKIGHVYLYVLCLVSLFETAVYYHPTVNTDNFYFTYLPSLLLFFAAVGMPSPGVVRALKKLRERVAGPPAPAPADEAQNPG